MAEEQREETKINGCLLQAHLSFPRKDVVVCGMCPNTSKDVGDLGKRCKAPR